MRVELKDILNALRDWDAFLVWSRARDATRLGNLDMLEEVHDYLAERFGGGDPFEGDSPASLRRGLADFAEGRMRKLDWVTDSGGYVVPRSAPSSE